MQHAHRQSLLRRRTIVGAGLGAGLCGIDAMALAAEASAAPWQPALREGGIVVALRHATAPGTFDPPGFKLGDCSTQRNLSEDGRAQARRIGAALRAQGLQPAAVRTSPWCRCVDTATLAFGAGSAEPWAALGSPQGNSEATSAEHMDALRAALRRIGTQRGRVEAWVTHMFVLAALVQENTASGEGLVLRSGDNGRVQLLGRIAPA